MGDLFLVNEAPVTDIGLLGDFSKGGGFKKAADKALVAGPGRLEKIKLAWSKADFDCKLYFAQFAGSQKYVEHGLLTPGDRQDIEKRLKRPLPDADPEAITVLFVGNGGAEWKAMTPWIIAHRFGHAINAASRTDPKIDAELKDLTREIERHLDQLSEAHDLQDHHFAAPTKNDRGSYGYGVQENMNKAKRRLATANAFGAMRSARTGNLRADFEFTYETIAQFLITGRVYLDKDHRQIITRHVFGRPQSRGPAGEDGKEQVEMLKRDYEIEIHTYIENLLHRCQGKIFVM